MKRSIVLTFASLLLVVCSYGETGIKPTPPCLVEQDVKLKIPAACLTPKDWPAAMACLDALVEVHPNLFPGAVMGYQPDGGTMKLYAKGPGFANNSVTSLASVSKPLVYVGLAKLVQDHFASPACTPMTSKCVFPQKFETPLADALRKLDEQRGTDVLTRWYNRIAFDDGAQQRAWKSQVKIKHIAQMTSGFPPSAFTGYSFCRPGDVCPELMEHDVTCNPDASGSCRLAFLYNQYLNRRGGNTALPNGCRPRPLTGPRLFNFGTYYDGRVDAPNRVTRAFERRYSFQPGLFGECVLLEDATSARWADNRTVRESDVAKFFLGMPLISAPGTEYHYSQPNLYVAAFLIEGVAQKRFDDYLKAQLFTPLGMTDTSFVVQPGTTQFQRLADIKRVPITPPARVLPDLAPPLKLDTIYGTDKNWDEPREGWQNRWPEGGAYSTATDLLRFLRFIRTGKAPDGKVLLNAESLRLVTSEVGPVGPRTYGFVSPEPGVIAGNGYFGTLMRRNMNRCVNLTILPQIVSESPGGGPHHVRLCDYQYGDVLDLRAALVQMIEGIPTACDPASPLEP